MPRLPRLARAVLGAACVTVLALTTASCGDDPAPAAADALAQRATAGLEQSYTATYELTGTSADPSAAGTASTTGSPSATATASTTATANAPALAASAGTVTVRRTPEALRLDVLTSTGTATSITTAGGTVACQQPTDRRAATCLTVAGAGEAPPAAFDAGLRTVFSDSLQVFAESPGRFAVLESAPATVTFAGETGTCFDVPSAGSITAVPGASPAAKASVATGTYCLTDDGVPVQVAFESGTATLTALSREAPPAEAFSPPAKPVPLPTT